MFVSWRLLTLFQLEGNLYFSADLFLDLSFCFQVMVTATAEVVRNALSLHVYVSGRLYVPNFGDHIYTCSPQ